MIAGLTIIFVCATSAHPPFPSYQVPTAARAIGECHYVDQWLPDSTCTPGATNPDVTQDNIASTICTAGWTRTIRPPVSYTNSLKEQQTEEYGAPGDLRLYEEDHLIPLELGGHPTDPKNLWPEPWDGVGGARLKDRVENAARRAVCDGRMALSVAQASIARDWVWLGIELHVIQAPNVTEVTSG